MGCSPTTVPVIYCRQESVSLVQDDKLRCWSFNKLDRTESPESRATTDTDTANPHQISTTKTRTPYFNDTKIMHIINDISTISSIATAILAGDTLLSEKHGVPSALDLQKCSHEFFICIAYVNYATWLTPYQQPSSNNHLTTTQQPLPLSPISLLSCL